MNTKPITFSILIMCASPVFASQLTCYIDPRTDMTQCIDEKKVFEKDGIRYTEYYKGGPRGVDKTSFTLHANCNTNVLHIKDRQGVSFAGGSGSATEASRSLRTWMCDAKPANQAKKKK